jgi:hypothetical protein
VADKSTEGSKPGTFGSPPAAAPRVLNTGGMETVPGPVGTPTQVVVTGQPVTAAAPRSAPTPDRPDPSRPGLTRAGGAYVHQDGKTVIDAEGRPIKELSVKDGQIVEGSAADDGK